MTSASRMKPCGDVVVDRRLALALAHLGAVGVEDQRQVGEARHARSPSARNSRMCLGVFERWSSPRMTSRDLHRGVVDHDREVVERRPVVADDDEVAAEVADVDLDVAAHDVVEGDDPLADAEAQRAAAALGLAGRAARPASGARSGRRSAAAAWPPPAPCGRPRAPRACSSRDRRGRRRAAAGRRPRTSGRRSIWRYGACGPRAGSPATSGPSSQSRPSQCRPSRMSFSNSTVLRATSVSSRRRTNVPPTWRAWR